MEDIKKEVVEEVTEDVKEETTEQKEENTFKAITSQEQLDKILSNRLERKEKKVREEVTAEFTSKYADYDSLKEQVKALDESSNKIKELEDKIAKYEMDSVKTKVANKFGIPLEMAERLRGSNEKELEEDAKMFAKFAQPRTAPLRNQEATKEDGVMAAFRKMNPNIKF